MKKTLFIILCLTLQNLSAQKRESNGFIALTVGPSFPLGQQSISVYGALFSLFKF
jgi:hypothetical protein